MKVEVLGVGTGLCPEFGNVSLLVWNSEQSKATLLDCGCTVYPSLRRMEKSCQREILSKIDEVFISHGHSDHLGSLDMVLAYRTIVLHQKTKVAGMDIRMFLQEICHMDHRLLIDESPICGLDLVKTSHVRGMLSYGCLVNDKLFYSGDSGKSLLLTAEAQKAELLIHEVSLETVYDLTNDNQNEPFAVHVGIDDLYQNSAPETRARTWLAHYAPQEAESLRAKAEAYGFAGLLEPGQIFDL